MDGRLPSTQLPFQAKRLNRDFPGERSGRSLREALHAHLVWSTRKMPLGGNWSWLICSAQEQNCRTSTLLLLCVRTRLFRYAPGWTALLSVP